MTRSVETGLRGWGGAENSRMVNVRYPGHEGCVDSWPDNAHREHEMSGRALERILAAGASLCRPNGATVFSFGFYEGKISRAFGRDPAKFGIDGCNLDISHREQTAWLGWEDSNSEMSTQIIALKDRTDLPESSRILALETIRV